MKVEIFFEVGDAMLSELLTLIQDNPFCTHRVGRRWRFEGAEEDIPQFLKNDDVQCGSAQGTYGAFVGPDALKTYLEQRAWSEACWPGLRALAFCGLIEPEPCSLNSLAREIRELCDDRNRLLTRHTFEVLERFSRKHEVRVAHCNLITDLQHAPGLPCDVRLTRLQFASFILAHQKPGGPRIDARAGLKVLLSG